jgi:hypothetical protein
MLEEHEHESLEKEANEKCNCCRMVKKRRNTSFVQLFLSLLNWLFLLDQICFYHNLT